MTPETDANVRRIEGFADGWVPRYISEQLERSRNLWKAEAERWRDSSAIRAKIADMRGQMNATYGAGRGWEAALDEMEEFLK